jgi:hypothetical protein
MSTIPSGDVKEAWGSTRKKEVKIAEQAKFEDYVYHPSLLPGLFAFPYLIPPAGSASVSHLRILIPDTIVVTEDSNDQLTAWWYYSDSEGRVRATSEFSRNALINKLGNNSFENTLAVVHKSPKFIKREGSGKTVSWGGNDISLLSTRQLMAMSAQLPGESLTSQSSHPQPNKKNNGGVNEGSGGGVLSLSPPYVLQRYVKPSGVKASMFRSELNLDRTLKVRWISFMCAFCCSLIFVRNFFHIYMCFFQSVTI